MDWRISETKMSDSPEQKGKFGACHWKCNRLNAVSMSESPLEIHYLYLYHVIFTSLPAEHLGQFSMLVPLKHSYTVPWESWEVISSLAAIYQQMTIHRICGPFSWLGNLSAIDHETLQLSIEIIDKSPGFSKDWELLCPSDTSWWLNASCRPVSITVGLIVPENRKIKSSQYSMPDVSQVIKTKSSHRCLDMSSIL